MVGQSGKENRYSHRAARYKKPGKDDLSREVISMTQCENDISEFKPWMYSIGWAYPSLMAILVRLTLYGLFSFKFSAEAYR